MTGITNLLAEEEEQESNLVKHARRELVLSGAYDNDPAWSESIIAACRGFTSYGHSGCSAEVGLETLNRLLQFKPLTPPTSDPAEWSEAPEGIFPVPTWQNIRSSSCLSRDGGKTYFDLDAEDSSAIVKSDDPSS